MAINISAAFDIEERESNKVILFTLQSFFIGIFISTFEIGSTSLFLDNFPQSDLPIAFIISGLIGIVFTTFFSGLQKVIAFKNLSIVNLLAISILTILMRFGFNITEDPKLIYVVFVIMGPLKVIAFLGFWGMASRVFTLRQGKRLFGLIDSGQVFGAIIIGFSMALITKFLPGTEDLLIISSISIIVTLLIQFFIINHYSADEIVLNAQEIKESENDGNYSLFKNRYVQFMVIFVVLSTISVFFIYNSFLAVTKDQFPESRDLTNFLGFFISMVMIFSFLFKTFLYSKLIQMYGLKIVLIILPILLLIVTLSASAVGTIFGFTSASAVNFTLFFILIALSQLFSLSLKNSLEVPAFKILYQPLPKSIRYDIQARIDGIVNETSAVLAGLALLGLSLLEFIELIHFSYSLIIILSAWVFITFKLYTYYKQTLQNSLSRGSKTIFQERGEAKMKSILADEINSESSNKVLRSLNLTSYYEPNLFEIFIADLFKNDNDELKVFALKKVAEYNMLSLKASVKELIKNSNNANLKSQAEQTISELDATDKKISEKDVLYNLVKSRNFEDRVFAGKILGEIKIEDKLFLLTELMKDFHPKVKKAAIAAVAKSDLPELWPRLVENLNQRDCVQAATSAIITIGERILPTLEQSFYKSGYTVETMLEILRIYGLTGGETSEQFLLKKINYPDGRIVKQALLSLRSCGYKAGPDKRANIHQVIETTISNTLWNMVALERLEDANIGDQLKDALEHEQKENYEFLFLLLSLAYDAKSIKYVQENIESGTSEGVGYAIELLDIFIAEELKPKLFPILEDNTINDKMKQLEPYFPIADYNHEDLIRQIINRNYNYTNRWTKACAIMATLKLENVSISNDLIASLFSEDRLIRQCAGWVMYNLSEEVYHDCSNRINVNLKRELDEAIVMKIQNGHPMLFDLTLALSKSQGLKSINRFLLCRMTDYFKMSKSLKGEVIINGKETDHCNLYYLWDGSVGNYKNDKIDFYVEKGQVFTSILWDLNEKEESNFKSESNTIYYQIPEENLFDLMNQYKSIAHSIYSLAKEGHALQLA